MQKIIYLMKAALYECMPPNIIQIIEHSTAFNLAVNLAHEDIITYSRKDPACLQLKSGADIHYRAKIGPRFVLDHGYNTVIGETTIIGSDSYILGSVVLGARGISGNPSSTRHPIIGNHVEVGAFSSILGNIHIGDYCFIGPNCTVVESIAPYSRVINQDYTAQIIETHSVEMAQ